MQIYAEYGFPIGTDVHHLGQISAIHDPLICSSKGVKSVVFRIYKSIATRKHLCASERDLEIKLKQNCHVHLGKVFALSWGSDDTFISHHKMALSVSRSGTVQMRIKLIEQDSKPHML